MNFVCSETGELTRAMRRRAFSLIEMVVVMGLVATLASLALGAVNAARSQALVKRARAELAVLAQVIGDYHRECGIYPENIETPAQLCALLHGREPDGEENAGRDFMHAAQTALREAGVGANLELCIVDPWDRPFQYIPYVRSSGGVNVNGFVLYSHGARLASETLPTAAEVVPQVSGEHGGEIQQTRENAANIYAHQ